MGGARYISVYKQASWKSEVEVTIDKDSSPLTVGGKQGREGELPSFTENHHCLLW